MVKQRAGFLQAETAVRYDKGRPTSSLRCRMFTPDDVQARLRAKPFVPLRITTSAGESFDVYHPDLVLVGRQYLIVGQPSTENPKHFEQMTQLSLMHVTALENLPAPSSSEGNGQP